MSVVKAEVAEVKFRMTKNGERILLTMSNGDQAWFAPTYITKMLASNGIKGARPQILVGSIASYTKTSHKEGDKGVGRDGAEYTRSKDGYELSDFDVDGSTIGAKLSPLDKLMLKEKVKADLKAQAKEQLYAALAKSKASAVAETEEVEEEEEEEVIL